MEDDGENTIQRHRSRSWIRRLLIGLGTIFLLLVVFHGPILRAVVHAAATHYAAGQNLKLEFRLEGDPFHKLELKDFRATATGPSSVRSLEAGQVVVDYSIPAFIFRGTSEALKNVELRDVTAVIDSSKALPPATPGQTREVRLPSVFPDRLEASNVNLTVRGPKEDTVMNNLNLGLYREHDGKLAIGKLQVPGVNTWTDITGKTTYRNKNLAIQNLKLDEQNSLETVSLDATRIGQGKLGLVLKGNLAGGPVVSRTELSTRAGSVWADTDVQASDVSFAQLSKYIGEGEGKLSGNVKNVDINLEGKLDEPWNWDGTINLEVNDLRSGGFTLDRAKVDLSAKNGMVTVHEGRIDQGQNRVDLQGTVNFNTNKGGAAQTPGNLRISVNAPDLSGLTAFMSEPATGSLQANGNLKTVNGTAELNLNATGKEIAAQGAKIGSLTADIFAAKNMAAVKNEKTPEASQTIYDGLTSNTRFQLNDVRYSGFAIAQVQGDVKSNGPTVTLSPLVVQDGNNTLRLTGNIQLPGPNEELMNQPADIQFNLNAPQLAEFSQGDAPDKITGSLQGKGRIENRNGVATGQIELHGSDIAAKDLTVETMDLEAEIKNDVVRLNKFTARLNEEDYINAQGTVKLESPFPYDAAVTAHLGKLSTFEPLLSRPDEKTQLAGSLVVDWKGQGDLKTIPNRGSFNLRLENGRYNDLQDLSARVEANYTPEQLNVPIIYLKSDKLSFEAILTAKDSTLEVSKIQIDQGEAKYATGYASIPFVWSHLGSEKPLFPDSGKVNVTFQSENLDLATLFRDLGQEPPVAGKLNLKLDAQGPVDQLQASLDLQLRNVTADAAAQLKPTDLNLALRLQNNQLKLEGKIQQPLIQPVALTAQLPLNVSELMEKKKLDDRTPINARIVMPRSSLNFVREFVPALRQLDGSMALNVNVDGTIADPAMSGAADMNILLARFENPTLPALTDFRAQLNFRNNTLRFDRFGGDMAGGPFTVSGSISFPKLTEPAFDLRLRANSVLVARNDNLTARVDADLKVEGPLKSASVSGQVLTTNSRFLKNIDIVPISLPGRPAPLPDPPSAAPALSFPDPPLRDWKFDIVIKSKEPFLIRGNLAAGSANIDMRMTGSGLHPELQGQVRLENFEATLPFSTLTINLGFLYFDPDDPLNPRIEMRGTSLIQDYTIHVYIYGTALNPEASFSSEPPLPQEDIIALLATGVTREDLSSSNVLASRGLMLLGKELYRKVFKKNDDSEPRTDSIFNRLSVEYSGADPRTGEQTATAKYRASDHVVLIGDIGVAGGFRGIVKYVIRFR